MQPDKRKYAALLARKSPPSPLARDCLLAFVFGGAICTVGEGVRMFWLSRGLDTDGTAAATAITMVFLGALLTCLHLYDKLAKHAGAGTIVPITGFANAIVSPSSTKARGSSSVSAQSCSSSPGRFSSTASPRASSTALCCSC